MGSKLSSLFAIKNIVCLILVLILFYEFLIKHIKIGTTTPCPENMTTERENITNVPNLDLNRIKMFYSRKDKFFIPSNLKQKDWHNYNRIENDKKRTGFGENGKPEHLTKKEKDYENKLLSKYGYNAALSDKISTNRSIPDTRHPDCRKRQYLVTLPSVSVVMPFYNERSNVILRSICSVLNRSPDNIIKEIVLVDDGSTKDLYPESFFKFIENNSSTVKLIHLENRTGLISARLVGAKMATGDVLVFLDSHIEANVNWLPPLLEPIALDYRSVMLPVIDRIEYDTFKYYEEDEGARGSFDWELTYWRLPMTPDNEKNYPEPFETPIMQGGLFAISRRFFWELGGYDPELRIWGGEQFELSFKIWQCGGRMLEAPCSRVGHVYHLLDRPGQRSALNRNYRRIAEVWMDEYAEYVYARKLGVRKADPGDLTKQKALREKLKCKPFKWFMTQIAFDLTYQFPTVEPIPFAKGRIRPMKKPTLCVDGNFREKNEDFILKNCHTKERRHAMDPDEDEQQFQLTWFNDIKLETRPFCWDLRNWSPGSHVKIYYCHRSGGNQQWRYYKETKQLSFMDNSSLLCLDCNLQNRDLFINLCDINSETQRWVIDKVNRKHMKNWKVNARRITGPIAEWKE